jgi:hypothetical protein
MKIIQTKHQGRMVRKFAGEPARAQPGERVRGISVLLPAAADDSRFQAWFGARLYLTPRDYDQVTGKCPKWSGVGKPRLVGHREPRHGGTKAQRNFVKDAQRREHRAVQP